MSYEPDIAWKYECSSCGAVVEPAECVPHLSTHLDQGTVVMSRIDDPDATDQPQSDDSDDEAPWPPHPELTKACPVCQAPPGFACVRRGTRWFRAPTLPHPHAERL